MRRLKNLRQYFPGTTDLLVFAILAIACAVIIHFTNKTDSGLALASFPIFVSCAVRGLWKHGRLKF